MNNNQSNDCVGTKFVKPSYYKKCILVMRCKSQIDAKNEASKSRELRRKWHPPNVEIHIKTNRNQHKSQNRMHGF